MGWKSGIAVALTVGALSVAPLGPAKAALCHTPQEEAALSARMLQTEFMIAALSCDQRANYNAFVTKFESELVPLGRALRQMFKRAYGGAAKQELNGFITSLANQASQRSITGWSGYCDNASNLFLEALALEPGALKTFATAQLFTRWHGVEPCSLQASTTE